MNTNIPFFADRLVQKNDSIWQNSFEKVYFSFRIKNRTMLESNMENVSAEKKNIGSLFDRIAGHYDRFNHLLSLNIDKSWSRKTVKQLRPCDQLLDVAVGTADLSIEILRRQKANRITGLDLSTEMMKIGAQKVQKQGLSASIDFVLGNAQDMPFGDGEFDGLTCAFGVRNFSCLEKGLAEFHRVMAPGGQLAILEFSLPGNPVIRFFYKFFLEHIMPLVGSMISHDRPAYNYLNKSVQNFVYGDAMVKKIEEAGFHSVASRPMTFGIATLYTAER